MKGIGPYASQIVNVCNRCDFHIILDITVQNCYSAFRTEWGTTPEQSGKTDTPVPSAPEPMWASAPTKIQVSNVCVFLVAYFKPLTFVSLYATMRLRDELVVSSKATEIIRCTYCR